MQVVAYLATAASTGFVACGGGGGGGRFRCGEGVGISYVVVSSCIIPRDRKRSRAMWGHFLGLSDSFSLYLMRGDRWIKRIT